MINTKIMTKKNRLLFRILPNRTELTDSNSKIYYTLSLNKQTYIHEDANKKGHHVPASVLPLDSSRWGVLKLLTLDAAVIVRVTQSAVGVGVSVAAKLVTDCTPEDRANGEWDVEGVRPKVGRPSKGELERAPTEEEGIAGTEVLGRGKGCACATVGCEEG